MRPFQLRSTSSFQDDVRGVSAIEFALILPLLLLLYLGSVQLSQAVSLNRKLSQVAGTVSDLVGQSPTLTAEEVDGIFDASTAVLYPHPTKGAGGTELLGIVVISIAIDPSGTSKVEWSRARNATPRTSGEALAASGAGGSGGMVVAEVTYAYTPPIAYGITGTIEMKEVKSADRLGGKVSCPTC